MTFQRSHWKVISIQLRSELSNFSILLTKYFLSNFSPFSVQMVNPDTTMLVTNVRNKMCWWQTLATKCVGDKFQMLVTDFAIFVSNIEILSSRLEIVTIFNSPFFNCHHSKVVSIKMSLTSLYPWILKRSKENFLE